jgi:hypothetical protein
MTRLPQPGSDDGTWGVILNDFLSKSHNSDGTLKNLSQSQVQNLISDLTAKVSTSDLDSTTAALVTNGSSATSAALDSTYVAVSTVDPSVSAGDIPFVPAGSISATDVQAAIEEVAQGSGLAIGARLHVNTNKTIANGSEVEVDFTTQTWAYGGASTILASNQIIAPVGGLYLLTGSIRLYGVTAGIRLVLPKVNYSAVGEFGWAAAAGYEGQFSGSIPLVLSANDVVTINVYFSESTGTSTLVGTADPKTSWVSLIYQGALA